VPIVFVLGVSDSATHLHGNATATTREECFAANTSVATGLGLTLLLLVRHHMEALDTVVVHELEELDMMVKLATRVGQTRRLSV
jgi:hypothetical protein